MKLLVASRNPGKLREIRALVEGHGCRVLGLQDLADAPQVVEDADTFLGNARKKAWALADALGLPVLADDSGLVVDALDGRPGVLSARFAGAGADDAANNRKLLEALQGVPAGRRDAAFECAMVLADPGPPRREFTSRGRLAGRILEAPRGAGGFGYDPLFYLEDQRCSVAELDLAAKNLLSHRGQALRALEPRLLEVIRGER